MESGCHSCHTFLLGQGIEDATHAAAIPTVAAAPDPACGHHPGTQSLRCSVGLQACSRPKELCLCLNDAVARKGAAIFLVVDGLDEYQPEKDHVQLVRDLKVLNSCSRVKALVSSRPWLAFEREFGESGQMLIMEKVNPQAIVNYIHGRLEDVVTDEAFAGVCWQCLRCSRCDSGYS